MPEAPEQPIVPATQPAIEQPVENQSVPEPQVPTTEPQDQSNPQPEPEQPVEEGGVVRENSSEDQAIEQGNDHQQAPDSPIGTEPEQIEDEEYEDGPDPEENNAEEEQAEIQAKVDELLLTSNSGEATPEVENKLMSSETKSPQQKQEEQDLVEEAAS